MRSLGKLDVMACILENSVKGSRRTKLMFKCNLKLLDFSKYEDVAAEAGLLTVSRRKDGVQILVATETGERFLRTYREVQEILNR